MSNIDACNQLEIDSRHLTQAVCKEILQCAEEEITSPQPDFTFYHKFVVSTGRHIPWVLDDAGVRAKLRSFAEKNPQGVSPLALFTYLQTPVEKGGLGAVFDRNESYQLNPVESLNQHKPMACLGFAALYYGTALVVGIDPKKLHFWEETDDFVHYHTYVKVLGNNGSAFSADPAVPVAFFEAGMTRKSNKKFQAHLEPLHFLSNYHMNRAYGNYSEESAQDRIAYQKVEFDVAMQYSPDYYGVYLGRAQWLKTRPLTQPIRDEINLLMKRTIELNPSFTVCL